MTEGLVDREEELATLPEDSLMANLSRFEVETNDYDDYDVRIVRAMAGPHTKSLIQTFPVIACLEPGRYRSAALADSLLFGSG